MRHPEDDRFINRLSASITKGGFVNVGNSRLSIYFSGGMSFKPTTTFQGGLKVGLNFGSSPLEPKETGSLPYTDHSLS